MLNIRTEFNLVRMILVYRVTTLCQHHQLKLTCNQQQNLPVINDIHTCAKSVTNYTC